MSAKKRAANHMNRPNADARRPKEDPPAPAAAQGSKAGLKWALLVIGFAVVGWALWKKFNPEPPKPIGDKVVEQESAWQATVDGKVMMEQVRRFLAIGTRVAGSPGSARARELITAELGAAGVTDVREQKFTEKTPEGDIAMTNVIGVLPGKRREGIALCAHYDSKLEKDFTFLGANDSASAVAVLFELARKLKAGAADRELTYYFVFFDGEESFREKWDEWKNETNNDDNTYGSRYFARTMDEQGYPLKALILLDMVGDPDYTLYDDPASCSAEMLWYFKSASKKTFGVDFFSVQQGIGGDDHYPFKDKMPVMDLIDLKYGSDQGEVYWHTAKDTIDKLSARSLERTGTLVLATLPDVEAMVLKGLK